MARARLTNLLVDLVNLHVEVAVDFVEPVDEAIHIVIELVQHERKHALVDVAILVIERVLARNWHLLDRVFMSLDSQVRREEIIDLIV